MTTTGAKFSVFVSASYSFCVLFGCIWMAAKGENLGEDKVYEETMYKDALEFVNECGSRSLTLCFKERALHYVTTLPNTLDFYGTLRIKDSDPARSSRRQTPLILPKDPSTREKFLTRALFGHISDYLSSHTFELKLPSTAVTGMQENVEEARKKKGGSGGKKGGMKSLLMILYLKAATIGAVALKIIGLVAFKALLTAKIALTIASIIALKKIVEKKPHTSTYEVHPHYDDYGHYDRSFREDLAYKL